MLKLNLGKLFHDKSIEKPYLFLTRNGFTARTAGKLVNGDFSHLSLQHLETVCLLLNCTPDDLFEWHPSSGQVNVETHPLQKLRRKESTVNITGKLRELSPQKLEEVKEFLKGL